MADAAQVSERLPGVSNVSVHSDELTLSVADGAKLIGPAAIALNEHGANVQELTLRTPNTGRRLSALHGRAARG